MKSRYIFRHESEMNGIESTVQNTINEDAWYGVVDEFISFLRGCGYQMTRQDVADYLDDPAEADDEATFDLP
jgi:hypothetical protein